MASAATLQRVAAAAAKQAAREANARPLKSGKDILEWYGAQLEKKVNVTADQRLKIAASALLRQVKININRPVLKYKGVRSGRTQVWPPSRSKPGEFPKVETGRLRNSIFDQLMPPTFAKRKAIVGTNIGYGLLLETTMDRSYLRRTLHEMQPELRRILIRKWWK